ncbi:hypothetical protein B0A50_05289 [Salinomyces thailandicus]|uniref:Uncharacterized protein n=1 Tax=Salinomyces thailandicus TaxID=706561 RepID=A0A4U0TVQ3_9PEZI|nr:hypothetical protein B0A50_05289 [Salinomyces thailandica]
MFELLLLAFYSLSAIAASQHPRAQNGSQSSTTKTIHRTIYANSTVTASGGTDYANASVPATGTGSAYASACNSAKQSWLSESGFNTSYRTYTTTTSDISIEYQSHTSTATYYDGNASTATPYTLCDGWPRINGYTETSISTHVVTHTLSVNAFITSSIAYQNLDPPACLIQSGDCAALNTSYYDIYNAYTSSLEASRLELLSSYSAKISQTDSSTARSAAPASSITPAPSPTDAYPPQCGVPTVHVGTTMVGDPTCFENYASIQLLYWPVTRVPENGTCPNATTSTMTMTPTISGKPNTFVFWNTTLTSPTVYMAFDGTWVFTSAGATRSHQSQLLLPQSSTAISSLRGKLGGGYYLPEPFNYADLDGAVPASVYRAQPRCYTNPYSESYFTTTEALYPGGPKTTFQIATYDTYATENICTTIWDDYLPILSIPPEFSFLTPAGDIGGGLSCPFLFNSDAVIFDPPKALSQATAIAGPTTPGGGEATTTKETTSPTAEPGTAPGPTTPQPTSAPQPTEAPSPISGDTALPKTQKTTAGGEGSQETSNSDPQATNGSSDPSAGSSDEPSKVSGDLSPTAALSDSNTNPSQASEDSAEIATLPGSSKDGEGVAAATTSRNVGDAIASALGMTTESSGSSATAATDSSGGGSDSGSGSSTNSDGDSGDSDSSDESSQTESQSNETGASSNSGGGSGSSGSSDASSDTSNESGEAVSSSTGGGGGSSGANGGSPDTPPESNDADSSTTGGDNDSSGSTGGSSDTSSQGIEAGTSSTGGDSGSSGASDGSSDDSSENNETGSSSIGGDSGSSGAGGGSSDSSSEGNEAGSSPTGGDGGSSGAGSGSSDSSSESNEASSSPTGGDGGSSGATDGSSDDSSENNETGSFSIGGDSGSSRAGGGSSDSSTQANEAGSSSTGGHGGSSGSSDGSSVPFSEDNENGSSSIIGGSGSDAAGGSSSSSSGLEGSESGQAAGENDSSDIGTSVEVDPITTLVLSGSDGSAVTLTPASNGGAVVAGSTLANGETASIAGVGNVVALSSGVIATSRTYAYTAVRASQGAVENAQATAAVFPGAAGALVTVLPVSGGGAAIGSATLSRGQSTSIEGIGNVVAGSSGVVVDGSSIQYSVTTARAGLTAPVVTIDGQVYTANSLSDGDLVLQNGQTTATVDADGAPITLGSEVISAGSSNQLIAGSSTISLPAADTPPKATVLTVGGQVFTADSEGDLNVGGTTLAPGNAVTLSGTTYSLAPSGSEVVVNGVTQTLGAAESGETRTTSSIVGTGASATPSLSASATGSSGPLSTPSASAAGRTVASTFGLLACIVSGLILA